MKDQLGDPEHKALRDLRIAQATPIPPPPLASRTTDMPVYRVVQARKAGRMLCVVLMGSAIISIGVPLTVWLLAESGYFNLIEWTKELIQ